MKTVKNITLLITILLLLTGCDFFRKTLGKPTSKELEQMRIESEAEAARLKAEKERERAIADSLSLVNAKLMMEQQKAKTLDKRYYVVLGSFKVPGNAAKFFAYLETKGLEPKEIKFKNGYDLVAVSGHDTLMEAYESLEHFLKFRYAPDDSYIYDTQLGYHQ